jgi:cell division protein FtsB
LRRFDFIVTCVCMALLGYFAWHAWKGPRGYPYRDRLEAEAQGLAAKFAAVTQERERLEHKVALLRPDSIDPDLLDELVRAQLELADPGDVVVLRRSPIPQENP